MPEIISVYDVESKGEEALTPGGDVIIRGKNIMIAGENEDVGVYFVNRADGSMTVVRSGKITRNTSSELIFDVPELQPGTYDVVIKSQRSKKSPTKETLVSAFEKPLGVK